MNSDMKKPKRHRDPNQPAKIITSLAIGEKEEALPINALDIRAVELGRLGGLKGGKARARKLSKAQRTKIAKIGGRARWNKKK